MSEQVNDRLLELFVSQKYHWKSLSTGQQMAIAVELLRHRCVEKKLYEFIEAHAEEKEAWKQYRKLLLEERAKQS